MARILKAAVLLALIASPALIHILLFHSHSRVLALALLVLQLGSLAVALLAPSRIRGKWLLAAGIGGAAGLIAWRFGPAGMTLSTGVSHTAIHGTLLALFGASLLPGREPLVTGMIRRIRGALPPELIRYGRQVTILWCGYFAAQLTVSLVLFLTQPLPVWSFFINVLSLPLVLIVFMGEFLFHTIRFRHLPRSRFTDMIKAAMSWRVSAAGEAASRPG